MKFLSALLLIAMVSIGSADQISAANGVLHRLLGRRADAFKFELIPKKGDLDMYKLEADHGVIHVKASSGTSLTRAAYAYLKDACHCIVTWDGDQVNLPKELPDYPETEVVCPNQYRHYYNVCTFGYTMAFWDWKKWEHEIDWMALHGINMPLAMTGQERVWEVVWEKYGLTAAQVKNFMTGPAFLPWHWMGNIDGHQGPLPQEFIDRQADLQKRILGRERDLGMTPVVPGFSGFVPSEFQDIYPRARVLNSSGWAGFPPTHQLDARDPMFPAVQRRFIEAYTKQYGTDHLYLCDLYNEMKPTIGADDRLNELKQTGKAIIDSILSADPTGKWVMQGWLFHNDTTFWKEPEIAAFLDGVPDQKMILLDLACDQAELWRQSAAFRKKPYMWCLLHGFGGATPLFGDLTMADQLPIAAQTDARHGNLVGMGLTMEGINENAAMYELMCDSMWRTTTVDSVDWLRNFYAARYGADVANVSQFADSIREALYTKNEGGPAIHYQDRPSLTAVTKPSPDKARFRAIVEAMLSMPTEIQKAPLFQRDLVDVTKRYAAEEANDAILACISAATSSAPTTLTVPEKHFDELMLDLDALLDTIPQYRLSAWIGDARHAGGDGDLLETNARMQVTVWGGPILNDYAAKEWSGLVGDFYRPRWDRFFEALAAKKSDPETLKKSSADWELQWCAKTSLPRIQKVDIVEQARKLIASGANR